ncbi:MAG TPA: hypothetical protein VF556_08510 [Pyrinomonadaceae bacterium]|jgi:hypothetical protein
MKSPHFSLKRFFTASIFVLALIAVLYSQKESDALVPALRYVPKSMLVWLLAEPFRPEYYAQESDPEDWSDAIEQASRAAAEQGGNTVKFACGRNYRVLSQTNLDWGEQGAAMTSVKWESCQSNYENASNKAGIEYVGGGDQSAFSIRSAYGMTLENIKVTFSNPTFTGYGFDYSHSDPARNGNGGDSAYLTIKNSTFTGTAQANQSKALIYIGGGIISNFTDVHFFHARTGLKGADGDGRNNHYAYVVHVLRGACNLVDVCILNPSSNWIIENFAFEPNKEGKLRAIDNDCGDSCAFASGITLNNNYFGDGVAQEEPIVRLVRCSGFNAFGNWFYSDTELSRAAFTLDGCDGGVISGNHGQPFRYFVETAGRTTFGLTILSNKINASEILHKTAECAGCSIMQPGRSGTSPVMTRLSALQASDYAADGTPLETAFGWKANARHFNSSGVFTAIDGAYGLPNAAMLIMSANNGDVPVCFGSDNKVNACVDGSGLKSKVRITVPGEQFGENWKNSQEVPTKGDIYAAIKALAEVQAFERK